MKIILNKNDLSIDKKYIIKRNRYFILLYSIDNIIYRSQMFSMRTNLSDLFKYVYKINYRKWKDSLILGIRRQDLYEIENFSDIQSVVIMQELIG